jgi:hypothetical protein
MQDPSHDFNWNRHSASTPSGPRTGPSSDHTYEGTSTGNYLYIEASSPRMENDTARLISPVLDKALTKSARFPGACFSFWYHMFGDDTGEMHWI